MPDLIDLLVLCVDAGLSLDSAMTRIVGQLQKINPVLSQEIQLTLDEINILPNRSQAFINFQNRAGSDLVTYFVLTVNQTTQYGTPLSATLKTLAEESRRSAMLDMEDRASRLPVLLSIPLILFILPPVVSLSVGPGFILMLRGLGG
ncbi:MAG: type II secretion system F family protein [Proteobacteria bacterium]|nr:type II secretion system F family protein [Pseudomonadota bacterium]